MTKLSYSRCNRFRKTHWHSWAEKQRKLIEEDEEDDTDEGRFGRNRKD